MFSLSSDGDIQGGGTSNSKPSGFINVISDFYKKKLQSSTSVPNAPLEDMSESVDQSNPFNEESGNNPSKPEPGIKWNNVSDASDRFTSSHEEKHISLGTARILIYQLHIHVHVVGIYCN